MYTTSVLSFRPVIFISLSSNGNHTGKLWVWVYPRVELGRVEIFGTGQVRVSRLVTGMGQVAEIVDPHTCNCYTLLYCIF